MPFLQSEDMRALNAFQHPKAEYRGVGRPQVTRAQKHAFVEQLAVCGTIGMAAAHVGISRSAVLEHRKRDSAFNDAVEEAFARFGDRIESIAIDRITNGTPDQVVSGKTGDVVDLIKHDNRLLETVLRAKKREEYSERRELVHDISDRVADRLEAARLRMVERLSAPTIDGDVDC